MLFLFCLSTFVPGIFPLFPLYEDVTSVPHLKVGERKVEDVVKQGEDKIEFEKVLGYHQHNHAGLGFIKQTEVPPIQAHDYRKLVSDKVHYLELSVSYLSKSG